jgi:hypothetical protein
MKFRLRRIRTAANGLLIGCVALATLPTLEAPAHAASVTPGMVITKSAVGITTEGFKTILKSLKPGMTLKLLPGNYVVGHVNVGLAGRPWDALAFATAAQRITVTAADPRNPPHIYGNLVLNNLHFWTFDRLIISSAYRGTIRGFLPLDLEGGIGWAITHCDLSGASATGAVANVLMAGTGGYPRLFNFSYNRVHAAGRPSAPTAALYNNVYVSFRGNTGTGGLISHNTIFDAPYGAGIKLGYGGVYNALGPWNVTVRDNTFIRNGIGIVLHGDVRGTRMVGNLFIDEAMLPFAGSTKTMHIYVRNDFTGRANYLAHNFGGPATMLLYDSHRQMWIGPDNRLGLKPRLVGTVPTTPPGMSYGATANWL